MPIINANSIQALCALDSIFTDIIEQYGMPPNLKREEGFETLSKIILEQQVSLESAKAAFNKLKEHIQVFSPENILQLSDDEMRACFISRQKTRYLKALATAVQNNTLDLANLKKLSEEAAKTELKKIVGIGEWTAKIYLMFCLESPDLFPEGDIAAINTVKELKGVTNKEKIINCTQKWSPYRTAATYCLWYYYLCKKNRSVVY